MDSMDTIIAIETVGSGECLHGSAVVWLDREVVFDEPCNRGCPEVLRREGFVTKEPLLTARAA